MNKCGYNLLTWDSISAKLQTDLLLGQQMHTPYTTKTGIQIGCRYRENGITMPIDDPDMLFLQEALLATPEYIRQKHLHDAAVALSTLVGLFVVFAVFLFS
jgi:hypothetical protein